MAQKSSGTEQLEQQKKSTTGPGSPATRYIDTFTTAWTRILTDQANSWTDIWRKMLEGNYDPKTFFADSSKLWAKGVEGATTLLMLPVDLLRYAHEPVPQLVFILSEDDDGATPKSAQLATKLDPSELKRVVSTPLRRLDGDGEIEAKHVYVEPLGESDCVQVSLSGIKGLLKIGQYAGAVYLDSKTSSGRRPLLLLTLFVTPGGHSS